MIGAAVGILSKGISNIINGVPFWYGMGKAAVIGGISGAISFGIGQSVTGMTNFVAKAGLQAGMHGIKSGLMTSIEGGDFMSGFAAGAVSSLVSSSVEGLGHSGGYYIDDDYTQWSSFGARNPNLLKAMMISSGGFSGGISSSIAGGNFWSGAREGLITSGLNHVAHMVATPKKYNVVTLLDNEGANGAGHEAIALQLKDGTYTYFSKDGGSKVISGEGDFSAGIFKNLSEIDKFYYEKTGKNYDRGDVYRATAKQIQKGVGFAINIVNKNYNLFFSNCSHFVGAVMAETFGKIPFFEGPFPKVNFRVRRDFTYNREYHYSKHRIL